MNDIIIPDCVFPTDNVYGIPTLDKGNQADFCEMPFCGWGCVSRRDRMKGTWHFYVDDYKFTGLWTKPEMLVQTKCVAAVELNYSLNDQMPSAVAIYRTYQKRWLARYWQSYGISMYVDLSVSPRWTDLNLMGVPKGWYAFATAATDTALDTLLDHYRIAKERAAWNEDLLKFVVYGGGKKVRERCEMEGWVNIEDARHAAAKKRLTEVESEGTVNG